MVPRYCFGEVFYNTIPYFIDTLLVERFSDNATNKDIPIVSISFVFANSTIGNEL